MTQIIAAIISALLLVMVVGYAEQKYLRDVRGTSSSDVFAVGDRGAILH